GHRAGEFVELADRRVDLTGREVAGLVDHAGEVVEPLGERPSAGLDDGAGAAVRRRGIGREVAPRGPEGVDGGAEPGVARLAQRALDHGEELVAGMVL